MEVGGDHWHPVEAGGFSHGVVVLGFLFVDSKNHRLSGGVACFDEVTVGVGASPLVGLGGVGGDNHGVPASSQSAVERGAVEVDVHPGGQCPNELGVGQCPDGVSVGVHNLGFLASVPLSAERHDFSFTPCDHRSNRTGLAWVMMNSSVSPSERLLNLVIALRNTTGRMTRRDIANKVAGYSPHASPAAFERMFERDKELLRDLGIPLVTDDALHPEDVGYRIDHDQYALGDVQLSAQEFAVLGVAAGLWRHSGVEQLSSRALTKLRAGYDGPQEVEFLTGVYLSLRDVTDAFEPVIVALSRRCAVRCDYRSAHSGVTRRRVIEPWRLVLRESHWYVIGRDQDAGEPRVFKLARMVGKVVPVGGQGSVTIPENVDTDALMGQSESQVNDRLVLAVLPGKALRLTASMRKDGQLRSDGRIVWVGTWDGRESVSEEIAALGPDVLVLEPAQLRDHVVSRLQAATVLAGETDNSKERHDG